MLARAVHETAVALWCATAPVVAAQNEIRSQQAQQRAEYEATVAAVNEANNVMPPPAEVTPMPPPLEPIPFLTDQECTQMVIPIEEIREVYLRLHRASFSNALRSDSEEAVKKIFICEGKFPEFRRTLRHLLLKEWADPRCLARSIATDRPITVATNASSSRPGTSLENVMAATPTTAGGAVTALLLAQQNRPKMVVEAYLYDIVQCCVDDREPSALLPYEKVWVRSFYPRVVEQPFAKFAKINPHPSHDAVFDTIFKELVAITNKGDYSVYDDATNDTTAEEENNEDREYVDGSATTNNAAALAAARKDALSISKEAFIAFFTICYRYQFRNAAPERSATAGEEMWYRGLSLTRDGKMTLTAFIKTCAIIARAYGKQKDAVAFTREILAVGTVGAGGSNSPHQGWLLAAVEKVRPSPTAQLLQDPESIYVHDELVDEIFEKEHFTSVTPNTILITGPEGVGKSSVAKEVAARLNVVNLDVEALAIKAADDPLCPFGLLIRSLVAEKKPIPLYLQAELLARALKDLATQHRGYVCGDIVPVTAQTEALYLSQIGFDQFVPKQIVRVSCPESLLPARVQAARQANQLLYAEELIAREEEQAAIDAAEAKKAESIARQGRNEALRKRKAAIEASNADPTPEEAEILNQVEEEEPEEEPHLDEEGNELSADEVAELKAAKLKAVTRRRFLAELHEQILNGRRPFLPPSTVDAMTVTNASYPDALDTQTLAVCKAITTSRNTVVTIGVADTAEKYAAYIANRLKLVASVVPTRPTLPEDALESLAGLEPNSSDYHEAVGQALETMIEESPDQHPLSEWGRHCPVTYFEDDCVLVDGSADYMLTYRGFIYFFASYAKQQRFIASPHPYLLQRPLLSSKAPILVLKSKIDTFTQGPDPKKELIKDLIPPTIPSAASVQQKLASELDLTITSLRTYVCQRAAQKKEIVARTEEYLKRVKEDAKAKKEADERIKKRAEAEALRRKKEEKANKTKKPTATPASKKAAAAAAAAATADDDVDEANNGGRKSVFYEDEDDLKINADGTFSAAEKNDGDAEEKSGVFPTDVRIQGEIDRLKRIGQQAFAPQLVSVIDRFDAKLLQELFESKQMPQKIVVFDKKAPPPKPAEGDAEEDAEEEEFVDSDEELDHVEEEEDQYDDEGNVIPKPPKPEDLTDLKQYRRFIRDFIEKLEQSTEQADEDGGISHQTATAVTFAATAAAADDGATPIPPSTQAFTITRCNVFNKSANAVVEEVLLKVLPTTRRAAVFEGELIEDNDDEAEENQPPPSDPLLFVGTRAAHQFGMFKKFCPVSLVDEQTFITGSTDFVATFRESRFLFASEAKMNAFIENPLKYISNATPPSVPPPRFWLLGTKVSGKSTVADMLSERFNIPFFADFTIEYFEELIAAAANESAVSTNVRGLAVPFQRCAALDEALALQATLKAFADKQAEQQKLKDDSIKAQEEREKAVEEGEEVDDLDEAEEEAMEKALAFEPEEEEVKAERLAVALRKMGAALMRIEPFNSKGCILVNHPASEAELEGILAAGGYPDAVITTRVSSETYVARLVEGMLKERLASHSAEVKALKKKRDDQRIRARERELIKWRRRNIGGDDDDEQTLLAAGLPVVTEEEEEEIPEEDPEAPSEDNIRAELEQQYETELHPITTILDMLPEKRIPLISVDANDTTNSAKQQTLTLLRPFLVDRAAILETPKVLKYVEAKRLISLGEKNMSYFGEFVDPVELFHQRYDAESKKIDRFALKPRKDLSQYAEEPEPTAAKVAGAAAKERKTRTVVKTVVRQNEDGEDEEVEEEEEVEEDDEEDEKNADENGHPEDEEEADLEPEPELEPEEIAEMEAEHKAAVEKLRERTYLKTAAFRNRIYFFKNESNLLQFVQNPFRFWNQPPPLAPVASVTVVVEDLEAYAKKDAEKKPSDDGVKSLIPTAPVRPLAYHLAQSVGAAFITIPKLLTWALTQRLSFPEPFASQLNDVLLRQVPLTPELITTLLAARLQCADALASYGDGVHGSGGCGGGAVISDVIREPADYQRLLKETRGDVEVTASLGMKPSVDKVNIIVDMRIKATHHIPTTDPTTTASLVAAYKAIKTARVAEQMARLRRSLGFPAPIYRACVTEETINKQLTVAYKLYCPFMWSRRGELVKVGDDRRFTVEYQNEFYCFSEQSFLDEFMLHPDRFDKATKEVVLPKTLPTRVSAQQAEGKLLQYVGCCPVTLYDTRDKVGLCGVAEPTAVKGTLFVEYDGKYYAVSSEACMERFLRQPWVYVEHPVLPPANKLPQDPVVVRHTPSGEKYVQLTLHEPIARAMVEVANVRPKYPSMSAEESARKFVALYLRANNPANTEFQARQHKENFEDFKKKATLYKAITSTEPDGAADEERFALWDAVQEDPQDYKKYAILRENHRDPAAADAAGKKQSAALR